MVDIYRVTTLSGYHYTTSPPAKMDARWGVMITWAILCALPIGAFAFSTGVLLPYLYSYIVYQGDWVAHHDMHIIASLIVMCGCSCGWMFGIVEKWFGPRPVYCLVSLGLVATLLAPYWFTGNFPGLLATSVVYGVLLVNMLAFITSHVSKYGGVQSGKLIGLLGFCFAFSGAYGNLMCSFIINHDNIPQVEVDFNNHTVTMFTDPGVIARTPLLWVGFSGLAALILLPGTYFLFQYEPHRNPHHFEKLENSPSSSTSSSQGYQPEESIKDSFKLLLCTKSFYALLVSMMAIGVAQLICGDFVKVYGSVVIKDDKFFNDAGIAIHATNALSRVFWGALSDKVNAKYILVFNNVIGSLLIPTLYIARSHKMIYIAVSCIIATSLGSTSVIPGALVTYHGKKNHTLNYGILLTGEVFGALFYSLVMVIMTRYLSDLYISVLLSIPAILALLGTLVFLKSQV